MFRNKLKYLLLLAVVGLLAILYNTYHMAVLFLAVLGSPVVMLLLLLYVYANVSAELVSSTHIVNRLEPIPITVQLTNRSILPITNIKIFLSYQNLYSKRKYKTEYMVAIDAYTTTQVTVSLRSEHAGNLAVTIRSIRIYDYLRIFSLKKRQSGEVKVAVLPNYYELLELNFAGIRSDFIDSDTYSTTRSGDDPSEIFEIREYREGDRLQRIHWKLSSKQNQLMIKEFSDPISCSILILIDLYTQKGKSLLSFADAILECALSLSYTLMLHKQMHYLAWYDIEGGSITRIKIMQEQDLFEAMDALLQAKFYKESQDIILNYSAEYSKDQYTGFYYLTGERKSVNSSSLSCLRTSEHRLLYIYDDEEEEEVPEPLVRAQEFGEEDIDFWPVDMNNTKRDLEDLSVS